MDELIEQLVAKVGLSQAQAQQVVEFLRANAHKIPEWLGESGVLENIKDKLPGGLGKLF